MTRASQARRIAKAAAYGGGGIGLVGLGAYSLLYAEAKIARKVVGRPWEQFPDADGVYGPAGGRAIRMVVLGDSGAGGLGVERPSQTPGALLASGLAEAAGRPVRLRVNAVIGARSAGLEDQVDRAMLFRPHIAMIMVGANDVTGMVKPSTSVQHLQRAVRRLKQAGSEVVVGTCPDLGTVEPIAQPLRLIARQWSRQLAAAQIVGVVEMGARAVSLADLLAPAFADEPRRFFSDDRFHPSAEGYAAVAAAILPSMLTSLGVAPEDERVSVGRRRRADRPQPVAVLAARAAETPGAEVAAAEREGQEQGPRGRWARLRRRRPQLVHEEAGREDAGQDERHSGSGDLAAAPHDQHIRPGGASSSRPDPAGAELLHLDGDAGERPGTSGASGSVPDGGRAPAVDGARQSTVEETESRSVPAGEPSAGG